MAAAAAAVDALGFAGQEELNVEAPTKAGATIEDDAIFSSKFNKWDEEDDVGILDEDEKERIRSKGFLRPDGQARTTWEVIMMFFTLYCAFAIPVCMAWNFKPSGLWFWFEVLMDSFFMADLPMNFRTGYYDAEISRNVYDQKKIATKYAKGWLLLDLPAAFPLSIFMELLALGEGSLIIRYLRVLRTWSRALRMVKVIKMNKLFQSLQNNHEFNPAYLRIVKFASIMTIYLHVTACGWFGTASLDPVLVDALACDNTCCDDDLGTCITSSTGENATNSCVGRGLGYACSEWEYSSWLYQYGVASASGDGGSGIPPNFWQQYHAAMYWALATVTTVGYGDISAKNHDERVYAIFSMSLGAVTFAFVCGNMTSLVINLDKEGHLFQKKLDMLNSYMRQRELTRPLKIRTRTFCRHVWGYSAFNEAAVLADLSPGLRMQLALEINEGVMRQVPLFSELSALAMALVCQKLKGISASPSDLVVQFGDTGREMYIVREGVLDVISGDGKVKYASLRKGSYFGEIAVVLGQKRTANVRARTVCDLFVLVQKDFIDAFSRFPEVLANMKKKASKTIAENLKKDAGAATGPDDQQTPRAAARVAAATLARKIIRGGKVDLRKCTFTELSDLELEALAVQKRRAMEASGLSTDEIERRALEKKLNDLKATVEQQSETLEALENQHDMN